MHENIIENEYISISEFAKRVNVSKQAIYQQLNKKLKSYLIVIDGVKKLNARAIEEVYGQNDSQVKSKENEQELSKLLIDSLNRQLEEKDRQIAELHRLIATSQMQLTESQHRLQELEDKGSNSEEENPDQKIKELEKVIENLEEENKKPWWKKIFRSE